MIVFATKISVKKVVIGIAALCAVVWGITTLTPDAAQTVSAAETPKVEQKLKTNEDRVAYLQAFGWEPGAAPIIEMEVQIPKEFDAAYEEYNTLQKSQGLDLSKYKGKRAMLYTYELNTHPSGETGVTASLVTYKDRIIAADISSPQADGFTHTLLETPQAAK